jgi:hypothetical protein
MRRNSSEVWSHRCLCNVLLMKRGKKPDWPPMESGRSIDPDDVVWLETYLAAPIFIPSITALRDLCLARGFEPTAIRWRII